MMLQNFLSSLWQLLAAFSAMIFSVPDATRELLVSVLAPVNAELTVIAIFYVVAIATMAGTMALSGSMPAKPNWWQASLMIAGFILPAVAFLLLVFPAALLVLWASALRAATFEILDAWRGYVGLFWMAVGIQICFVAIILMLDRIHKLIPRDQERDDPYLIRFSAVMGLCYVLMGAGLGLLGWWGVSRTAFDLHITPSELVMEMIIVVVVLLVAAFGAAWIYEKTRGRLRAASYVAYAVAWLWAGTVYYGMFNSIPGWLLICMAGCAVGCGWWVLLERRWARALSGGALGLQRLPSRIE